MNMKMRLLMLALAVLALLPVVMAGRLGGI